MGINLTLILLFIAASLERGAALECYKCPVEMKDILHCSDPFENLHYQTHCDPSEDVCLKISVAGSSNHIEERGCAKESSVPTICDRVQNNFPEATCSVCHGELCNAATQPLHSAPLFLFSISATTLTMLRLTS